MSIKSSEGVFDALRVLARATAPMGAAELAAVVGLPVTTAIRALATLEAGNYAKRDNGSSKFVMGGAGRMLAHAFMAQFPIRDVALPYLQQLASVSGVSCSLFQRLGWSTVRIAFVAGTSSIINMAVVGESRPLVAGAAGLAILAHSQEEFSRPLREATPSGTWGALSSRFEPVRNLGYALEQSVYDQGGYDLAIGLLDPSGEAFSAIALEGLALTDHYLSEEIPAIKNIVADLQRTIHSDPSMLHGHYDHVSPESIDLTTQTSKS